MNEQDNITSEDIEFDATDTSNIENDTSASSASQVTKKPRISWKWCHFTKENNKLLCKVCRHIFSIKTSHTILKRHQLHHSDVDSIESEQNEKASPGFLHKKNYQVDINDLLIKFIIHGQHSYRIVEEQDFVSFLSALNNSYRLPSRFQISSSIQKLYIEKKQQIVDMITNLKYKIALTFDFWTSVTNKPYIVVTAHYTTNNGEMISLTLEFDLIPFPHKSEQIVSKVKKIVEEFGLQGKLISITTDNDATNIKTLQLLTLFHEEFKDIVHLRCMAHVLNLVVKKGVEEVKDIIAPVQKLVKFITFSPKKKQLYEECCKSLNITHLNLIKDMSIRWNSTYMMLERALKMKRVLNCMCLDYTEFSPYAIESWEKVEALVDFFQPFYEATVMLSKHNYPSLYYVVPILDVLTEHLNAEVDGSMNKCALAMIEKLNEYSELLNTDLAQLAILLDPRLNNNYFITKNNTQPLHNLKTFYQNLKDQNLQELRGDNLSTANNDQSSCEVNPIKKSLFASVYKQPDTLNITDEVDTYINMPIEPENTNVLIWWKKQKELSLSTLAQIAFEILSIPATSIPSEQAFSKSGNLITKKRNRLSNKNIQASMCLSSWLKIE